MHQYKRVSYPLLHLAIIGNSIDSLRGAVITNNHYLHSDTLNNVFSIFVLISPQPSRSTVRHNTVNLRTCSPEEQHQALSCSPTIPSFHALRQDGTNPPPRASETRVRSVRLRTRWFPTYASRTSQRGHEEEVEGHCHQRAVYQDDC